MTDTLRLLMPQWQGGNNPPYVLGAQLLAWLAPESANTPQVEVPVEAPTGEPLPQEGGVVARSALLRQLKSAQKIIDEHQPDRIIVFGGDCLVAQAPFAYLNEKYQGNLGILWLDTHPDVSTPEQFCHEHAMVLGNLLGEGDPLFAAEVKRTVRPEMVMFGGVHDMRPYEEVTLNRLNIRKAGPKELSESSEPVLKWIEDNKIGHLAVHFDLDVLSPQEFRAILPCQPGDKPFDAALGEMTLSQISRLIQDVAKQTDLVGLAIAEHLPWDAINLKNFLASLPIFK